MGTDNGLLSIDVSSNNGNTAADYDLHLLWASGERVLTLKVSESDDYVWDASHALAAFWHHLGGIVNHYHFLHPGSSASGTKQADWFWNHVRQDLGVGDRFIVDAETKGETGAEVHAFIDRCHDHAPSRLGLIYGGAYFLRDNGITPRRGWGLHVAAYNDHVDFIPPGWGTWSAWQFTSTARMPGIKGQVDVSRIRRELRQPTLHAGDHSVAVVDAKRALAKAGFGRWMSRHSATYGNGMVRELARFKHAHGWGPKQANGSVLGGRAWAALDRYL